MTLANHNLIKFLARVAVEEYLNELSQHKKLSSSLTEKQLANGLLDKQISASLCPNTLSNHNQSSSSDSLEIINLKEDLDEK